eukprot:Em0001g1456a
MQYISPINLLKASLVYAFRFEPLNGRELKHDGTNKTISHAELVLGDRCLKDYGLRLSQAADSAKRFNSNWIDANGIHATGEKLDAILMAPVPSSVPQLRSFLGMINYYSKFIPNLATLLNPLNELLRKDVQWKWTDQPDAGTATSDSDVFNVGQIEALPVTAMQLRKVTRQDPILSKVVTFTRNGWPSIVPENLKPYWTCRNELTVEGDCL